VKQLGAAEAFAYHSPSCGSDIHEYTRDGLGYAVDCITDSESMKCCYAAIGAGGGRYVSLDPFPIRDHTRRAVKPSWIIGYTIYGRPINWKRPFKREARPQDREFARHWYPVAQELLDKGLIKTHPLREEKGGLAGVIDGADRSRKSQVSGAKLVYRIR
jgi:aspyridone synthetase trans-acting enoyl reductase